MDRLLGSSLPSYLLCLNFYRQAMFLLLFFILVFLVSCGDPKKAVPAGALKASQASVQFGADLPVNVESPVVKFTITNSSTVDVTNISYLLERGQDSIFLVGSNCTSRLASGTQCNVSASIKPDQKGKAYSDTFLVKYKTDAGDEVLRVRLAGSTLSSNGVEVINNLFISGTDSAESNIKTFADTNFGSVSDVVTLGVTYVGAKSTVIQVALPTNKSFRTVTDCVELNSGERCNVFATFAPIIAGSTSGKFIISSVLENENNISSADINLVGVGKVPPSVDLVTLVEVQSGDKKLDFGSVAIGDLSTTKAILLSNSGTVSYLYRLSSTLSNVAIDYGNCTGRLAGGESCIFNVRYGPSVESTDDGYVSFVSGRSMSYIEVKGSGISGTKQTIDGVEVDKSSILFASSDEGFSSDVKAVKITNKSGAVSGRISMNLQNRNTPFSYTTSCVNNAPLKAGASCEVYLSFRPAIIGDVTDELSIGLTKATAASTGGAFAISIKGSGRISSITDNTTNINNLHVSVKKYNFPDTGAGLRSAAHQFEIRNVGATAITGFTSSSTDLIRFPLDAELTTCGQTIAANSSCVIAYKFNASAATQYNAFIKIWANGSTGATVEDSPELIELIGRGVLYNQYIYFGYVDNATVKFKDVTYAAVNETPYARKITRTEIETVRWLWDAKKANELSASDQTDAIAKSAKMKLWFPDKTSDILSYFTRDLKGTVSTTETGSPLFFIVSDTCKGSEIQSGSSCLVRIRYDVTKFTNEESKQPVSAYVKLYADDGNGSEVIIDQFHAVASGVDNQTYFFPPEDRIGATAYERPLVIWDSQGVVIDQNIFTYSGANVGLASSGYVADNKVRRYDAARNVWQTLRTTGKDYMAMKWANGIDGGQVRMVAYNKKLYFYGGEIRAAGNALLGLSDYLGILDLDLKASDSDAEWSTLSLNSNPGGRGQTNMVGFNNKLYVWGGLQQFTRNIYFYDLLENKWYKAGQEKTKNAVIADIPEGCTIPQNSDTTPTRRGYAAMIFFGNKLFMHAGMHNTGMDNRPACGNLSVSGDAAAYLNNDLWAYEVENYNDNGGAIHDANKVNKWERLTDVDNLANIGVTPQADPVADLKRPYAREKHEWDIVGKKLLLKASGFAPSFGNEMVTIGAGNYYFFYDPASGGKTSADPYNGWSLAGIKTDNLAQHKLFIIGGVVWFYNKNIMGVQISSEIEALSKR